MQPGDSGRQAPSQELALTYTPEWHRQHATEEESRRVADAVALHRWAMQQSVRQLLSDSGSLWESIDVAALGRIVIPRELLRPRQQSPAARTIRLPDAAQKRLGVTEVELLSMDDGDPPALFPEGVVPWRYDGERLAFLARSLDSTHGCPDDAARTRQITQVIEDCRREKRIEKARIEASKEHYIGAAKSISEKKRILRWYHHWVLENGGWDLQYVMGRVNDAVQTDDAQPWVPSFYEYLPDPHNGVVDVRCPEGHTIYQFLCGEAAYSLSSVLPVLALPHGEGVAKARTVLAKMSKERTRFIYVKRGHPENDVTKHYIRDSNGVLTRRYVSRAFLVYNLATMFGVRLSPGGRVIDSRDEPFAKLLGETARERLCRKLTDPDKDPAIEVVAGLSQQEPRYRHDSFGDTHGEVFDIRRAASYEPGGLINPDFAPYRFRGTEKQEYLDRIAIVAITGYCEDRRRTDPMKRNERASMQVRNGSGPGQPFISAAATQEDYKIIRGNKGERFDDGAENIGSVLVDLSIAKLMGAEIVNQHAPESDRFKLAYDRYFDRDDIVHAERQVAQQLVVLASGIGLEQLIQQLGGRVYATDHVTNLRNLVTKLKQAINAGIAGPLEALAESLANLGVQPEELGVTDEEALGTIRALRKLGRLDAIQRIVALQGDKFDHKSIVKRPAARELEEYIASARKNREVLLDRIPAAAIVALKVNDKGGRWPGFPMDEFVRKAGGTFGNRDGWYRVTPDSWKVVGDYVSDNNWNNLKKMFKLAAERKKHEDESGAGGGFG